MYCKNCGKEIPSDSKFCPDCGFALGGEIPAQERPGGSNVTYQPKNEAVSIILSIILPGAGHIYAGAVGKGLKFMLAYLAMTFLMIGVFFVMPFLAFVFPLIAFAILVYAVYDSYQVTKQYNDSLRDTGYPPW